LPRGRTPKTLRRPSGRQIEDHEHDFLRFKEIETQTKNERVRQFASETYPILQQHLAPAKAVEEALGGERRKASR
jgi:hypothetical protein